MNQDNKNEYKKISDSLDRLVAFIMIVIKYNLKKNNYLHLGLDEKQSIIS